MTFLVVIVASSSPPSSPNKAILTKKSLSVRDGQCVQQAVCHQFWALLLENFKMNDAFGLDS